MLINKFILRAAGAALAAIVSLAAQPLKAQAPSDDDRIAKLERAVEALQKRNAQLESEIAGLKKQQAAFAAPPPPEGKMKTVVSTDGKNYVEKLVPDLGAEKWKLAPWITELELYGDLRMNTAVADCLATIRLTQMIGRNANVNAIVFAWASVERFWMIGSLACV